MKIIAVVAAGKNRVIGDQGKLPWHIRADLKHFKKLTLGHPVVMGRKTFESIGRCLPGRRNIVLTRDPSWKAEGVDVFHDHTSVVAELQRTKTPVACIVGGGELYQLFLPMTDTVYLTEVDASPKGDAYFPDIVNDEKFELRSSSQTMTNESDGLTFRFLEYARKS